jgi:hypothetical protein
MLYQVLHSPGIKFLERFQKLRREPEFYFFALGLLFSKRGRPKGRGKEDVSRADCEDVFSRTICQCTGLGAACADDGQRELELTELHDGLSSSPDDFVGNLNALAA